VCLARAVKGKHEKPNKGHAALKILAKHIAQHIAIEVGKIIRKERF
jgi:hypothetical protein